MHIEIQGVKYHFATGLIRPVLLDTGACENRSPHGWNCVLSGDHLGMHAAFAERGALYALWGEPVAITDLIPASCRLVLVNSSWYHVMTGLLEVRPGDPQLRRVGSAGRCRAESSDGVDRCCLPYRHCARGAHVYIYGDTVESIWQPA